VSRGAAASALLLAILLSPACDDGGCATSPGKGVEIIEVPAGDEPLAQIATRELQRARREGRVLLIYVGATWCEPCTRFHDAAKRGELDQALPNLRLLELDHDRDEARLKAAGCVSELIPLFAMATADGRCDPRRRVAGGVKGAGAVPFLTKRLQAMLGEG
jgi:hypothetical protein